MLYVGPLTNRIYLTFRYKQLAHGVIEVTGKKYDVTNQVGEVLAELDRRGLELTAKKAS